MMYNIKIIVTMIIQYRKFRKFNYIVSSIFFQIPNKQFPPKTESILCIRFRRVLINNIFEWETFCTKKVEI